VYKAPLCVAGSLAYTCTEIGMISKYTRMEGLKTLLLLGILTPFVALGAIDL